MDKRLVMNQYKTNPEDKLQNKKIKITFINIIIFFCCGSGFGVICICQIIVTPIRIGRMLKGNPAICVIVSGRDKSVIQKINGCPRNSTARDNVEYNANIIGIWINIGRQPEP